jgi:hypothetical protein
VAALAFVLVAMFAMAARAQAAETVYWDNYSGDPDTIGSASIDGSGGGLVNLGALEIDNPEGMAYDSVTNRLFVANEEGLPDGGIAAINLDGTGATQFTAPGAPIEEPEGIVVDPATRTLYWINTDSESISWARLDGSAGGLVNISGTTVDGAYRLALDPVGGKLYWGSSTEPGKAAISFAATNNSGGGTLNITGATAPESVSGIAVDSAAGRVYWIDYNQEIIAYASVGGGNGGTVNNTGATFDEPYGLAFDPALGKFYWGNYSHKEGEGVGAIGVGLLSGGGGSIDIASTPVDGVQDPVVLKSPTAAGVPTIAQDAKKPASLTCSQGAWGADSPGSFVYQAPRSYAYQWSNNGAAIGGATASTYLATAPGSYTCAVTATNQTGSASQTSAATKITASKVTLKTKKKAKVKPGGVATFKVTALNQGDLEAKTAKVCAKLPKKAKKAMKAPKCKKFGKLAADGKRTATLKFKVKNSAKPGTYKLTFQVKGSAGKAAKAKILVQAPKPKKK